MPKFREIYWSNSKKTPGQTAGRKDGESLFHRILLANAGGLTSTTAVDWHLEVKDIDYDIGLKKNIVSQSACKKISSIHTYS